MARNRTAGPVRVALSVALMAICAWIQIPMVIPVTMQTFAVCMVKGTVMGMESQEQTAISATPMAVAAVSRVVDLRGLMKNTSSDGCAQYNKGEG